MRTQKTIYRAYEIVEKFDFVNDKSYTRTEYIRECENTTLYIDCDDDNDDITIFATNQMNEWVKLLINPTDSQMSNLIKALCY